MKNSLFTLLAAASLLSSVATAETEWIHKTLKANTLASPRCETKDEAIKSASKANVVNDFAQRFCATQGYGWAVESVQDTGKVVCNSCGDNASKQQCHIEDMVTLCRRIKPGSVGLLPGKG